MKTKLFSFVSIFSIALFFASIAFFALFEPFTITLASMTPQSVLTSAQHQAGEELYQLALIESIAITLTIAMAITLYAWLNKKSIISTFRETWSSIGILFNSVRINIVRAFFFTTAPTARQLE